jgi:serine/threonine protein kinase
VEFIPTIVSAWSRGIVLRSWVALTVTEPTPPLFGAFRLVRFLRTDGPYQIWQAENADGVENGPSFALRRAEPELADNLAVKKSLEASTAIARRVAHENVILCHGVVEVGDQLTQIAEYAHDISLDALIAASSTAVETDLKLAVWIGRQILEAIVHAESLGVVHGNISPRHVYVTREGSIKVDFGIAEPPHERIDRTALDGVGDGAYRLPMIAGADPSVRRSEDVYSVAAILFELLTRQRHAVAARKQGGWIAPSAIEPKAPPSLDAALRRALAFDAKDPFADAKMFRQVLARVFYVDLDADDDRDGGKMLLRWAARLLPDLTATSEPLSPDLLTNPSAERPKGTFTKMLEERAAPVKPKELAEDDHDSDVVPAPDSSWAPGRTIANALKVSLQLRKDDGSEKRTEALPNGGGGLKGVPIPRVVSVPLARSLSPLPTERIISTPEMEAQKHVLAAGLKAPLAPTISGNDSRPPPNVSASSSQIVAKPVAYEMITWALLGFAMTFFVILGYSLFTR